jgi:hypothetical protein
MHLSRLLPLALLLVPGLARAEDAWLVRAVEARRWPDAPAISLSLATGDKVAVLYRADGLVRVRKETSYGWVPEDALTSQAPVLPDEEEGAGEGAGAVPAPEVPAEAP